MKTTVQRKVERIRRDAATHPVPSVCSLIPVKQKEQEDQKNSEQEEVAIRIVLQLALEDNERRWARSVWLNDHYMGQGINGRGSPETHMVIREEGKITDDGFVADRRDRVGIITFSRMQSSYCRGWYGSYEQVAAGLAKQSQWEMLSLARFWLDPRLQDESHPWYIEYVASQILSKSLLTIVYDYLVLHPPAFPLLPWEIKEIISYCNSDLFTGALYTACGFTLARENTSGKRKGLRTYSHTARMLFPEERIRILLASRQNKGARERREEARGGITHEVLLIHKKKPIQLAS